MPSKPRTIIFANGLLTDPAAARAAIGPGDRLIAADGGLHHMQALGLRRPDVLIGDLDSIEPAEAEAVRAAGGRVERFPVRKDQTDLELAVHLARAEGAAAGSSGGDILIFGALGGRWDQTLANLLLLAHPEFRDARLRLVDGAQQIYLVQRRAVIEGEAGDTVSLISLQGDARGVTTEGLEYPLRGGTLPFGSTLGISNVLVGRQGSVAVEEGLVACIVIGQPKLMDERQL